MKLIILDRDGVINHESEHFIKTPEEWRPLAGAPEAIALLTQWGWHVVVATNQSGIGRGLFSMDMLNAINDRMVKTIAQAGGRIDAIFYCPHAQEADCACRKPKPGLMLDIADRFGVDLAEVPVVGDSLRDLQAAKAAGAKPWLVLTGKGQATKEAGKLPRGTKVFADLAAVAAELTG
ncbi:MAG: D-glycero-beta-D-manno-heptose 1,7-bisphosphate 7-phosphatase [Rhodocyclaceae bacterium]|nr:D-glycero-beta-D-manno-heptose 1,7-bisphosphate 7-phosphatase [Rhodocyclaceae bacterium]